MYRAGELGFAVTDRDDDDIYIHMLLQPFIGEDAELPSRWYHHIHQHRRSSPKEEQYWQSYTHPVPPEPGFTSDFTAPSAEGEQASNGRFFPPTSRDEPIILDDDDNSALAEGSSASTSKSESAGSGQLNALLVCAKCLDPLILNSALGPEEGQYKRVWALRCGHLIDEKCLNILGQPPAEEVTPDKKGKGKARASTQRSGYAAPLPEQAPVFSAISLPTDIRSRLRSRRSGADAATAPAGPSLPAEADGVVSASVPVPSPTAKKRRVVHRKPKVEAEFEWPCPVASCGRIHVSVRIEGVWGPEKEVPTPRGAGKASAAWTEPRGAVAVFA